MKIGFLEILNLNENCYTSQKVTAQRRLSDVCTNTGGRILIAVRDDVCHRTRHVCSIFTSPATLSFASAAIIFLLPRRTNESFKCLLFQLQSKLMSFVV